MDKDKYIELAGKVADGTASDQEIALYNRYYNAYQHKYPSWTQLDEQQRKDMLAETQEEIHNQLHEPEEKRHVKLWPRIVGIAAAVAAIVFGVWFFNGRTEILSGALDDKSMAYQNDIAPGKNTATIKIGDGAAITLSDKQTGVIVGANNLTYNDGSKISGRHPESNPEFSSGSGSQGSRGGGPDLRQDDVVVTTPRGGTYQVTLPDGTKVWLNAASVLTYTVPLKERGGIRKVELSGEAYFEVFRNKNQPFVVNSKKLTTRVLGTHFNISAYDDEQSVKATLLEGSVRLQGKLTLKPGEQGERTDDGFVTVKQVDAELAVAWKNGVFRFNNASLETVLRQMARWYDVEVVYPNGIPDRKFTGDLDRNLTAAEALELLRFTKVKFKIEGKKIIVNK